MQALPLVILGAGGRMGGLIAQLAQENANFIISALVERRDKISQLSAPQRTSSIEDALAKSYGAVIIDFTSPETSLKAATINKKFGNPHVIGTTGFDREQQAQLQEISRKTPILWSANMSVGITALVHLLPKLISCLGKEYDYEILDIHHKHKKDAPSGTAIKLGECIAKERDWELSEVGRYARHGLRCERSYKEIGIQSIRGGDVVGVHTIYCLGPGERIEITHEAQSRENFAFGALRAAQWLANQRAGRLYTMSDVLGLDDN